MIRSVRACLLDIPLTKPYHLSFTDVLSFRSVITIMETDDGLQGLGESTALPGYSSETSEEIWNFVKDNGGRLPRKSLQEAMDLLSRTPGGTAFVLAPLMTAIETIAYRRELGIGGKGFTLELVGIVNSEDPYESGEIITELLKSGYKTLKVKVGRDVHKDIERVRAIQNLVGDRAKIRLDANQGYDYPDAERFVKSIDPFNIELFEQPFGLEAWDEMTALSKSSPLPLMLDESIRTQEDLEKTYASGCARYVKFKLMKAGGFQQLQKLIRWCRERDIAVVLGNGVAGEIGCYHEALIGSRLIDNAGEMNGFLKQKFSLFRQGLTMDAGKIDLTDGYIPALDQSRVADCLIEDYFWES